MIKNVGIDIIKNKRIKVNDQFASKILAEKEFQYYSSVDSKTRQREYLAGRWAVKEALIKALEYNFPLNTVCIATGDDNKLKVTGLNLAENEFLNISLSHEEEYSVGIAILSEK
ncbi:holo-ACP synthase [Spiroplasma sp. DGKH1]|uniref:holo-ACP synthase n=1 Tax=Spiroplasma sp. DGKH1 TaxID=3050074 RepID=UPI0034C65488